MKFELLMQDLWMALEQPDEERPQMCQFVHHLQEFLPELVKEPLKTRQVLCFVEALRCSERKKRHIHEEQYLETLSLVAWHTGGWLNEAECQRLPSFDVLEAAPAEFQPRLQVLRDLHDSSLAFFSFNRPYDRFRHKRRCFAYEILGHVSKMVDLPEMLAMARESIKKVNFVEIRLTASFLKEYFNAREIPPDQAICDELLLLAATADSRATVSTALDALVEIGALNHYEALSRMDDWQSKQP
jgi:hypothetical protein